MKYNTILLFTALLSISSCSWFNLNDDDSQGNQDCDKEEREISSDDLFACRVNGEIWKPIPISTWGINPSFDVLFSEQGNESGLSMQAKKRIENCESTLNIFYFLVQNPKEGDNPFDVRFLKNDSTCNLEYELDTLSNRNLNITLFDKNKNEVRGTFEFQLIQEVCRDTITVTEGTFIGRWL